ncbi:MAG: response regulator transcription factor [Clostridiales bacterium]|nr:response regulator transcription factor [Clostridiales bacterium]
MVYYIIMKCVEYKKILIVEDCDDQRVALEKYFSAKNTVTACATVAAATAALYDSRFDIILLDLILPDGSGLSILDRAEKTPVVIFSDLGSDSNLLDGFAAGAVDYVVKPASFELIEARMALRLLPESCSKISAHGLVLDISRRTAAYRGTALDLTSSEFNILTFLMQNAGNFYTAVEIYEQVWKMPHLNTTTIKAHLSNLRKKMFSASKRCADLIVTEFGKGYSFTGGGNE